MWVFRYHALSNRGFDLHKLTAILLVLIALLIPVGARAVRPQSDAGTHSARKIEITDRDLFATKGWNSTQVCVLGFRLGMSRAEATKNAYGHRLRLVAHDDWISPRCSERCVVCDAKGICPGIALSFSSDNRVSGIHVQRIPEDAAPIVRRAAIVRKFRGRTYSLFNRYSNDLRLGLVGLEDSKDEGVYKYLRYGLTIFVSVNPHGPECTSDLTVTFAAPESPCRK